MSTIKERLTALETKVDQIQKDIIDIKENHFNRINKDLGKLKEAAHWKPKDYIALITAILAFIAAILVK